MLKIAWLRFMDPEAINPVLYNMVRDAYRDGDYDEGPRRGYRERMAANTQGQRQGQVQRAGQRQGDGEGEIARRPVRHQIWRGEISSSI